MTSIIKVDQIQKANGATPTAADLGLNVAGTIVRMGSQQHSNYAQTGSSSYVTAYTFQIPGVTAGNQMHIQYSINDLVETANTVYFQILNPDGSVGVVWARNTNGNGGWRGIVNGTASYRHTNPASGTNTYTLQFKTTAGQAYLNYPSGIGDCSSFLTYYEIAG